MTNLRDQAEQLDANQGTGIDPTLLADLTRALLPYLGPYSITTVKRAARSTNDANDLVRQIANHLDDIGKREMFMKSAMRILSEYSESQTTAVEIEGAVSDAGGRPSSPVTPELAQRGEAALAPIIGPLASVLVARYANASQNSREFFERLAAHLRTPEERDSFFMSVRTGSTTWRPH